MIWGWPRLILGLDPEECDQDDEECDQDDELWIWGTSTVRRSDDDCPTDFVLTPPSQNSRLLNT